MKGDWAAHQVKVSSSKILLDVLRCIELYEVGKKDEYIEAINKKEGKFKGVPKSQYKIAAELNKKYPSILRALSRLEDMGLISKTQITGKGGRAPIIPTWTYKATILFPEYAPLDPLSGVYSRFFGDWKDCTSYFSKIIRFEIDEADAIMVFLCWKSRDFLRWVRDEIILPRRERGERPIKSESHEYWRNLAIKYLIIEYILHICEEGVKYFDEAFRNISEEDLEKYHLISDSLIKLTEHDVYRLVENLSTK